MPTKTAHPSTASKLALRGGAPVSSQPIRPVAVTIDDADIQAVVGVLQSGMLAMGARCSELEREFAARTDAAHALTCANGTCALQLAYEALLEPGDEVLCPAWSYVATASMLVARGCKITWIDADPDTYNLDVTDAKAKLTPRSKAIVATHMYGNPVDIDGVEALAADHGLKVIYDAAQAHLAGYRGHGLGAFGDAVTYSFYATKNMTTGEGGMVTVRQPALAESLRLLRSHGETEKYVHGRIGYNYRMSDVEAALGLSQLAHLAERTQRRRDIASRYDEGLRRIDGLSAPAVTEGAEHVYHLYPVKINPEVYGPVAALAASPTSSAARSVRDLFVEALRAEGVGAAVHYPHSLTQQPVFQAAAGQHPPVAARLAETLLCLPVHHALNDEEVGLVLEAVQKVSQALRS